MAARGNSNTEVATTKQAGTAIAAYDYGEYAGTGFENQTRDDYSIPFLGILQGLSPQLETLDGSKPGMIVNTVTNDLYPRDGVVFVPAWTEHSFVEWKPREEGGGFVAVHAVDSDVVREAKAQSEEYSKIKLPNGNDLIETFYVYGLRIDDETGALEQTVIAFTSTKIKKYKAWMTKAKMIQLNVPGRGRINAPLPAHRYKLSTVKEKNTKGEYWNWEINFDGANAAEARLAPDSEPFQEAINIMTLIKSGAARANHESQNAAGGTPGDEGGQRDANPEGTKKNGKAPF